MERALLAQALESSGTRLGLLEIRFLGQYDVRRDGEPVEIPSRPSRVLFAYLALTADRRHPRQRLAGLLWPDSDETSARGNLRQALWRLRRSIGESYLLVDNNSVAFNAEADVWLDTALLASSDNHDLEEAAAAYEGELLPGYYEDWVQLERERLSALFERVMARLLQELSQQERWSDVVIWAEHWLTFGQTPEQAYRSLMIAQSAEGNLAAVASTYERCASALELEVGVEPSIETRELYQRLLSGDRTASHAVARALNDTVRAEPPHNLPYQWTDFVGRERESAQLNRLLSQVRLLTIVGPGGTGKTRLALHAAAERIGEYRDGVYFVSLARIEAPDSIAQAIAETIGFPLSSQEDSRRQLLRQLRRREYLLVLDNFEHLLPGAALVAEILQRAEKVTILTTSRERLNLTEEALFHVEGLAYPTSPFAPDALDYGAIRLFIDGARRQRSDFKATSDTLPVIAHICRLLEGMPLAILLAAAWIDTLTLEEIAAEIDHSLDFLQAEWPDAPDRHHSVRAAFDPSWLQLSGAQRQLFAAVAVFRGGFTKEAAEAITGASLKEIAGLVNKSLVRRDLDTGRFELHELLRQYAREHLAAMPQVRESVMKAHAAFFADLMHRQWLLLIGNQQRQALATIESDLENIRDAWRYWLKRADAGQIEKFLDGFWRFHDVRGWFKTGAALFDEAAGALKAAKVTAGEEELETVYAKVLGCQAAFLAQLGYTEAGFARAGESVEILHRLNRSVELAFAVTHLRWNASYVKDPVQAMDYDLGEVKFSNGHEGQWRKAYVRCWQGRDYAWRGEYERAREQMEESLQIFEMLEDELAAVWPRLELGQQAVRQELYEEARAHFGAVLRVAEEHDFEWAVIKAARYLGNVAMLLGELQQARGHLLTSLRFAEQLGAMRDMLSALYDLAVIDAKGGDRSAAIRLLIVVRQHPLSNQTRSFSVWLGDRETRFSELAKACLGELAALTPPEEYAAALEEGQALELDVVAGDLLKRDYPFQ
jgi:predicted ATPase/DNA-binding SARP family transcriptional activator